MKKESVESLESWNDFQRRQEAEHQRRMGRARQMIADGYDLEAVRERFGRDADNALESMGTDSRMAAYRKRSTYKMISASNAKHAKAYAWNNFHACGTSGGQ